MRALVREVDPNLPLVSAATLAEMTAFALVPHRLASWIAGTVGLIGLLLVTIGVYGMTAHDVTRRTREIGIRIALGALPWEVLRMVARRAMGLAALGALIGLGAAALATRLLTSLLYGVRPLDPVSFTAGTLVLALLALAASLIPARRAASLDPVEALRVE
jgi:ABC-type antimicrobial peptide transport system permease subunit